MTNNERCTGNPRRSMRLHVNWGVTTAAILVLGVGGWAATTELAGAVISTGFLVVDSNVKKVQHPTGGVVGELRVRDGDSVKRGDIVVRLDETQTKANLAIIVKGLDENGARQARLEAERDGIENVLFSAELMARISEPEVASLVHGEHRLFGTRQAAREGQVAQLRERIAQLKEQIVGLNVQVVAKKREIELIGQELQGVRGLWQKNLAPLTRV